MSSLENKRCLKYSSTLIINISIVLGPSIKYVTLEGEGSSKVWQFVTGWWVKNMWRHTLIIFYHTYKTWNWKWRLTVFINHSTASPHISEALRLSQWNVAKVLSRNRFLNTFIHSGYLYSAPSRNLLWGALSPAMAKEKCLRKLAERRHAVDDHFADQSYLYLCISLVHTWPWWNSFLRTKQGATTTFVGQLNPSECPWNSHKIISVG